MHDWNEMQILERVASRLSVTRAAQDLGLPKSTVSRTVTRLEARLGLQLIERSTRRLRLTDAGQQYVDLAIQMAGLATAAERQLSELKKTPTGLLRISTPPTFLRSFLAPSLGDFLRKNPLVDLEFLNPGSAVEADIYLRASAPPEDSPLHIRMLGRIPVSLFASPSYMRKHGIPATPDDLLRHSILGINRKVHWRLHSGKREVNLDLTARLAAADPAVHLQLALEGCGIAASPLWLAAPHEHSRKLVRVLPGWQSSPVELMALFPGQTERLPKTRVFLEFLISTVTKQIASL